MVEIVGRPRRAPGARFAGVSVGQTRALSRDGGAHAAYSRKHWRQLHNSCASLLCLLLRSSQFHSFHIFLSGDSMRRRPARPSSSSLPFPHTRARGPGGGRPGRAHKAPTSNSQVWCTPARVSAIWAAEAAREATTQKRLARSSVPPPVGGCTCGTHRLSSQAELVAPLNRRSEARLDEV